MSVVEDALAILREEEGFAPYPYQDTAGGLIIGYGCNLLREPLEETEAEWLLLYRVEKRVEGLLFALEDDFIDLPVPAKSVLIAMAFQMGMLGTLRFKNTLRFMREHAWDLAADEMLDSKWAREDTPARAQRMAEIIRKIS